MASSTSAWPRSARGSPLPARPAAVFKSPVYLVCWIWTFGHAGRDLACSRSGKDNAGLGGILLLAEEGGGIEALATLCRLGRAGGVSRILVVALVVALLTLLVGACLALLVLGGCAGLAHRVLAGRAHLAVLVAAGLARLLGLLGAGCRRRSRRGKGYGRIRDGAGQEHGGGGGEQEMLLHGFNR